MTWSTDSQLLSSALSPSETQAHYAFPGTSDMNSRMEASCEQSICSSSAPLSEQ